MGDLPTLSLESLMDMMKEGAVSEAQDKLMQFQQATMDMVGDTVDQMMNSGLELVDADNPLLTDDEFGILQGVSDSPEDELEALKEKADISPEEELESLKEDVSVSAEEELGSLKEDLSVSPEEELESLKKDLPFSKEEK